MAQRKSPPCYLVAESFDGHIPTGKLHGLFTGTFPDEFGQKMVADEGWVKYIVYELANEETDALIKKHNLKST